MEITKELIWRNIFLVRKWKWRVYVPQLCGNYENLLSRIIGKKIVKVTDLLS